MSENKFIKRLKGEQTAKSVLEIKNESAKTSFANMPQGTSNAIDVFSDHRGNATAVLNGTTNWKVSNSELLLADAVSGDGQDFTSTYSVSGSGLWVNASYTFPSTGDPRHPVAMVFNPSTKWVLKVCGDNLIVDGGSTVDFTMLVKIGTASVYSKNFTIRESAGQFSKEFIIDFGEANSDVIKAGGLSTLTVQLLCGTANASARIYNGMTVLTCLQRKVDASAVSNSSANVEDVLDGNMIPSDYFSNPAFIDQIEDGDTAVAIFARDGDDVNLDHWEQPIPDRTGNAGKFLQTPDGDKMSWEDVEISDVTGLQTELNGLQGQITTNKNTMDLHIGNTNNPHNVTKAQVGLSNVDNTSDLNKPISTATQTALDLKADKSTTYTKTETDTLLGAKQDNISDLATIRSGAALGATALQPSALNNYVTTDTAQGITGLKTIKNQLKIQSGSGDGALFIGADVAATTLRNGTRKIARVDMPTNEDITLPMTIISGDTLGDSGSTIGQTYGIWNRIEFGGRPGAAGNTSPDGLAFCVAKVHNSKLPTNKVYALEISATQARFNVQPKYNGTNLALSTDIPTTLAELTNDTGFITSSALAPYALSADLATVATTGDYDDLLNKPTIPTVGNGTITITQGGISKGTFTTNQSGNTTIALDAGGGGIGNIDNITITANADDEIQAVAVIDQNTGIAKTWTGTMAEYEAIVTKDPETEYIITDDIGGSATVIAELAEGLNDKVDVGHQVIAFQAPTAANNYTWYRKYADGWVEQGGYCYASGSAAVSVSYPIELSRAEIPLTNPVYPYDSQIFLKGMQVQTVSTTGFTCRGKAVTSNNAVWENSDFSWQVSGMAA